MFLGVGALVGGFIFHEMKSEFDQMSNAALSRVGSGDRAAVLARFQDEREAMVIASRVGWGLGVLLLFGGFYMIETYVQPADND